MFKWPIRLAAAALATAVGLHPTVGKAQQETEVIFAIPALTLTFSTHFVAQDAGLFKKEGLKVKISTVAGVRIKREILANAFR